MKNINVKKLILIIFTIFCFVAINICMYYGYQYGPVYAYTSEENIIIKLVLVYALLSSIFYFMIIYLYGDTEKFKLKTLLFSAICCILHILYPIASYKIPLKSKTLSYAIRGNTGAPLFLVIAYIFVWLKINWLQKTKYRLLNLTTYKKSRKKKNLVLSILDFLTENPLIIVAFLLLAVVLPLIDFKDLGRWFEYGIKPALIILIAMAIMSIIQIAIVMVINAFYKDKKTIREIIIVSVALIFLIPYLFEYDYFDYRYIKDKIVEEINYKKEADENKKQLEKELASGAKNFLSDFEVAENINTAKKGDVVKFGRTFVKNDMSNKEDAYYYVLEKKDKVLTLVSLYCIDMADIDSICGNGYKGYYDYLDSEYYNNAFSDEEKKMMVDIKAQDNSIHKVYVPSAKDIQLMIQANDKSFYGVVNNTTLKEIRKHTTVFNDHYFRGICDYLLEPHMLKPNTIRIKRLNDNDYAGAICDYSNDDIKRGYYGVGRIFLRTKIMVAP